MAVDEALLEGFREGDLPIFRLYGWECSLSAGRFSNLEQSIDTAKLKGANLTCVRRISGGGILVHGNDLSYSLIVPRALLKEYGVKESYGYLCRFLLSLYEMLGHKAVFAADLQLETFRSDICLAGNEAYDITINGKKMGGNAQRHTRRVLLQHGTIPIRFDRGRFDPLFKHDSGLEEAVSLERLGDFMEYETLSGKIQEAFIKTYAAKLLTTPLRPDEEERAIELLKRKYTQERWNLHGEH